MVIPRNARRFQGQWHEPRHMSELENKIPLNFDLLKEPANWIILTLMVTIVALGLALIFHSPSSTQGT